MKYFTIDTNVLVTANGRDMPDLACQSKCIDMLEKLRTTRTSKIIIEFKYIFEEYKRYLNFSGQPGVGDAFFIDLYNNLSTKCKIVDITPHDNSFEEVPEAIRASCFDPNDHKFIAASVASREDFEILNACDTDWNEFSTLLLENGIRVSELCPHVIGD